MDPCGEILRECSIDHNGQSITDFLRSLNELANGDSSRIAVAIEVPRGPVVEAFLEAGFAVFSINPKQLDRFRDRHTTAGAKDDMRDAYVAADSLRTDQHCFRRIAADHQDVVRLRELSRTEEELGRGPSQNGQTTLPDEPWIWALLELAPLPQRGAKLTVARLKALLIKYHIRRWSAKELQVILRTPRLPLSAGSAEAISEHALVLLPQLRVLYTQRKTVRDGMKALLDQMSLLGRDHPECREHHDLHILLSIPGLGCLIAADLLPKHRIR